MAVNAYLLTIICVDDYNHCTPLVQPFESPCSYFFNITPSKAVSQKKLTSTDYTSTLYAVSLHNQGRREVQRISEKYSETFLSS